MSYDLKRFIHDCRSTLKRDPGSTKQYRLNPGQAGIFQDGAIHSIDYPDGSRFVRVTGANLDRIARSSFDPKTGAVKQMAAQRRPEFMQKAG